MHVGLGRDLGTLVTGCETWPPSKPKIFVFKNKHLSLQYSLRSEMTLSTYSARDTRNK